MEYMEIIGQFILFIIILVIMVGAVLRGGVFPVFKIFVSSRQPGIGNRNSTFSNFLWSFIFTNKKRNDSAKFLDKKDFRKLLNSSNKGLLIDGIEKRISEKRSFEHLAIIGRSGGGKTSKFIIPNLLSLDNCSMIVTDLKGELYNKTSGYLARKGFDIKVINLANPAISFCYNPLFNIRNRTDARSVADIIISTYDPNPRDKFWTSQSKQIISIMINCLINMGDYRYINLPNVWALLYKFGIDGEALSNFFSKYADDQSFFELEAFLSTPERTLGNIMSTARDSLEALGDSNIADITAGHDINFSDFRKRKTVLYIIVPVVRLQLYKFFLNLFYTQMFNYFLSHPEDTKMPVYCLLDEFGQMVIPNFSNIITMIRSYNVSISIMLQSITQLEANYQKAHANTILNGGIGSKVFFSGCDLDTIQMLENILGKVKYRTIDQQGNYFVREENLMNADKIRVIQENEMFYLFANKEPVFMNNTPYYENRKISSYSRINPTEVQSPQREALEYLNLDKI